MRIGPYSKVLPWGKEIIQLLVLALIIVGSGFLFFLQYQRMLVT